MILAALLLSVPGLQEEKPPAQPAWMPRKLEVVSMATGSYRFAQDLDGAPGDVAVSHAKISFDVDWMVDPRDFIRFNFGADHLKYDFSGDAALLAGVTDLFEDMNILRFESTYTRIFDENWSGIAYASVYDLFETGASPEDGISLGAGVGAMYRSGADLMLGGLFRVQQQIEDDPYVFVLPWIEWKISERLALKTEYRAGYGYYLSYALDEEARWAAETRGYYIVRRYRLDRGSVPDEGIVEDQRGAWDAGIRYQAKGIGSVSLHVGLDVWQEYEISDKRGRHSEEIETEPAPFVIASFSLTF